VYLRKKALIIFSSDMSSLAAEGGIRNYVKQFISSRTDLDIDLLTVGNGNIPEISNAKNVFFEKVISRPTCIFFYLKTIFKIFAGSMHLPNYDCIIFNRHEDVVLRPFLHGSKCILLIHGSVKYGFSFWPGPIAYINSLFERLLVPLMDVIYVLLKNPAAGVAFYKKRYPRYAEKIKYAPVPISNAFILNPSRKDTWRESECLKIIYFGRIVENPKNVLSIAKLGRSIKDLKAKINMTFAGDGPDAEKLKEKVKELDLSNETTFLGNVSHEKLPYLIASHHLSIIMSSFEGICMSAIESLAIGVPVAAFPVGDIPEYIVDNANGILLQPQATSIENAVKVLSFIKNYEYREDFQRLIESYYCEKAFAALEI